MLIGAIGIGLMFSGLPTVIAAYVVDATDAATDGPAYAAATLAFGVAQAVSPQIGGIIADAAGSFTPVFVLSAAFAVFGAACSSRLPRHREGGERRCAAAAASSEVRRAAWLLAEPERFRSGRAP